LPISMQTKRLVWLIVGAASLHAAAHGAPDPEAPIVSQATVSQAIVNPAIDAAAYLRVAGEAFEHRSRHRLSEAEFIRMSREPGTVVLDARSKAKYDELHVEGAIHLSYPDIAIESLATMLPDRSVRILIYCNNNFRGAEGPFPSKLPSASLNLATYAALYDYGYRNVYELGPLIDFNKTGIVFATSAPPLP
jgi:hypothetical protein